jgi:hypothetical protein
MKNGLECPEPHGRSIVTTDLHVLSNIFTDKIYSVVPEQQIKLNENNEP